MRGKKLFPEIVRLMKENKETQKDIGNLIGLSNSEVSRKLNGKVEWSIGEAEILCKHYDMGIWELFRKEN